MCRSLWRAALFLAMVLPGCDPPSDPVPSTMPLRDETGAALRSVRVDSLGLVSYVHAMDVTTSERVLFGSWAGVTAVALLRADSMRFVELDTLRGASISNAAVLFNCVGRQGALVSVAAVTIPIAEPWTEDSLRWAGWEQLSLWEAYAAGTTVDTNQTSGLYPEIALPISSAIVEQWIADPSSHHGFAIAAPGAGAVLQFASAENNFSDGVLSGPRLSFLAALNDTTSITVLVSPEDFVADTYVISPDSAAVCSEDASCLRIGHGIAHRMIVATALPAGFSDRANIHRAALHLRVLDPLVDDLRRDRDLVLDVYRLTSPWPEGGSIDSMVTSSGVVWHSAGLLLGATEAVIPVTNLVQSWKDGVYENQGFLIRARSEAVGLTMVQFAGMAHPDVDDRPYLEIIYTLPHGGRP